MQSKKSKPNILIACEESQAVCIEFRNLGLNAYSCDIQDCSGGYPQWHIRDNVMNQLKYNWDLIIAHPPCTYMSNAGARWMYTKPGEINLERLMKAEAAKAFFMIFFNLTKCKHICIENPQPLKIIGLPKPSQIIQPYMFGEPYSKKTMLWLKGLPKLRPTKIVDNYTPYIPSNTSKFAQGKGGSNGIAHTSKQRSKTFKGIASAMAIQWSTYLNYV